MSHLEVYDEYLVMVRIDQNPTAAQIAVDALCGLLSCVVFSALFALSWMCFSLALTLLVRGLQ